MTAVAIINTSRDHGYPAAVPFYQMFPNEPVLPDPQTLHIDHVHPMVQMRLTSVLDAIDHERSIENVVLVCHGTSEGPDMPLTEDPKAATTMNMNCASSRTTSPTA